MSRGAREDGGPAAASNDAAAVIDWNDGRLVTLTAGDTARCDKLSRGELYALLFYNIAAVDADAPVTLVWSSSEPPVRLTVPGTTSDSGPASFALLSGDDSRSVSASLPSNAGAAAVSAFIVSVSMPRNTAGLTDQELPPDGQTRPFGKLYRYHAIPPKGWSSLVLASPFTQLISVQMQKARAQILVLNLGSGLAPGQPLKLGPVANQAGVVEVRNLTLQSYEDWIPGDGGTWVWMNGDSPQNSADATISLQPLSRLARLRGALRARLARWLG